MIRVRWWRALGTRTGATLVLLVVFWLAAAAPAVSGAVHLLRAREAADRLGPAVDAVVVALQEERRLSIGYLAGGSRPALDAGRQRTDRASTALGDATRGWWGWVAGGAGELPGRLGGLRAIRDGVDARRVERGAVLDAYAQMIGAGVTGTPEPQLTLSRAREMFAEQDALLAGALGTPDGPTDGDRARLAGLIGGRGTLLAGNPVTADPAYGRVRALEEQILLHPERRVTPADWSAVADPVRIRLRAAEDEAAREAGRAGPSAVATIIYFGLVGGFGLVAVVAVLAAARGRKPRTSVQAPPERGHRLEDLLLDLHRRCQQLVHRQLRLLDGLQRRVTDDETLVDLFRADHLANRVRRQVEKAIMLAGGTPGRRWREPVPITDVVRGAAAATADYQRVSTAQVEPASLAGSAVTDLMHVLTELIDNATTHSRPDTRVRVEGRRAEGGYTLTVTDAGPGMTADDLVIAHQVMAAPEPPDGGTWTGLYAAGRFARRQGVAVVLRGGPAGGLVAEVTVPGELISAADPQHTIELPVVEAAS